MPRDLQELVFIRTSGIFDKALFIALETGSKAADSFYIAASKIEKAIFISNDRFQIGSAKKSGIEVYFLLHDKELVKKRLLEIEFEQSLPCLPSTYPPAPPRPHACVWTRDRAW